MEEQIISLYSKLKSNLYKNIIVSYYSSTGGYKTETFKLIGVSGFSYITVSNSKVCKELYFFNPSEIIESITIDGDNTPIYFNQYAKKLISEDKVDKKQLVEKIKADFLANTSINQMITPRESFLIEYYNNKQFHFDDLFFSDKQKEEYNAFLNQITKELVEYAKSKGFNSEIKLIGGGSTSYVYAIGDKVLKIGKPRTRARIPYCEYLLQPIINREILFDGIPMHIEVTQKVITYQKSSKKEFDEFKKQISKLKRQLHSIGLNCSDLHIKNIGILTQDNVIHFDSIPFQTGSDTVTSITNNNSLATRKKGDFVIIDLDYLEIVNMRKYCRYLARIGYNNEKISEFKEEHREKSK